jgi:hypothetical protein
MSPTVIAAIGQAALAAIIASLVHAVWKRINRPLTPAECEEYFKNMENWEELRRATGNEYNSLKPTPRPECDKLRDKCKKAKSY